MLRFTGQSIDKDECFYCFHTPFESDGIFISTDSNRSYCAKHLPLHYRHFPDDSVYLNLTKIKKQPLKKEPKQIKLEIKQQSESELYDIKYSLYQYDGTQLHKVDDEAIDEDTEKTINDIINSNSTAKTEELKSWQLDIQPCQHTINFKQSPIENIDLKKCGECELEENLWICLTCGVVGCGRAQFGGVPGNTHALKHFAFSGHPIAVKLGSLSRDVTDLHCYCCNEEIKIPGLNGLLRTFGIDPDNFVKTEKSLVELQIEQNLQWEFNLENEKGEKLPSVSGPELTGLKNLGNSCYLSSVSQVLFSLPEYKQKFDTSVEDLDESDTLEFQLKKLARGLISGEFSIPNDQGYQLGIAPSSFKRIVGMNHEEFSSMRQQDAFEFWNYLLEKIDAIDPDLNDIFRFVTVEKFKFDNNEVKLKSQITENLTIPIEIETAEDGSTEYKRQNFIDGLIAYLAPEEIDWDNKGKKAYKSTIFKTFPKYLVTSIQRIQLENWVPIKIDVPLTLPESFDIKDYQPGELLDDDEVEIHDEEDTEDFQPQQEAFNNLLQMGFPENRAKKAMYITGNGADSEAAMNWLFEHMEDPTIDDPIEFKTSTASQKVDETKISSLQDMGFSYQLSKKALVLNMEDVNASIEWLFSNPDDDGVIAETPSKEDKLAKLTSNTSSSSYRLKAVICHKGTQVTSGHYVAFIKKADGRWILFNDEKVIDVSNDSKSWNEIERNGYFYIWESFE